MLTAPEFGAALPIVADAWAAAAAPSTSRWRVDAVPAGTPFARALGGGILVLHAGDGGDGVPWIDDGGGDDVVATTAAADDDPASLPPPSPRLHAHVVYSPCYAAPTLLLRCIDGSGTPLTLAAIDAALPAAAAAAGAPLCPPPIAPADHPAWPESGGWGVLHPCGGGELAGEVVARGGEAPPPAVRLAAWLSFAAPAAGVRVPLRLGGFVSGAGSVDGV